MNEIFSDLTIWHWLVFGLGLMGLEVLIPGAFFLWPGLAAIIVGLLTVLIPGMGWTTALIVWATLSVLTVVCWILYRRKNPAKFIPNTLNRRGEQYVGKLYTLAEPTHNGQGTLRVDDTVWKVVTTGTDITGGTQIRVTGIEGTSLRIEAVS